MDSGKPLSVQPSAHGRDPTKNSQVAGPHPPAGKMVPANEECAPAVEEVPLVLVADHQAPTWAKHIVHFLQTGELPYDQDEAERVAWRANMYQFVDDTLYRRRPNGVKLKCVCREEGKELPAEIHTRMCGSHIESWALVGKAFRQGFYWSTALQDAIELVTKCEACQFHSKKTHLPAQALQTIPLSWPFLVWGSISSAPSREQSGALNSCLLPSTSLQSGQK